MGVRATTIRVVMTAAALVLGAGLLSAPPSQAASLPTLPAAGANDWSCTPTKAHPSPVVIVHGTFGDSKSLLDRLSWRMHTAGYLSGPSATNIKLQSKCPLDLSDHLLVAMDGPAIRLVLNALGRKGPASPSYQPSCLP